QNNLLSYAHGGSNVDPDSFKFSVLGSSNAILGNQVCNFIRGPVLGNQEFNIDSVGRYPNPSQGSYTISGSRDLF
ncbi:hypothetical protein, partial [Winogradskyella poriferorum]|uniref:hypothetical protein n=1 Tax=Winogradskyella poriferorum TaxID=307627 RepID=UPI003D64E1FB